MSSDVVLADVAWVAVSYCADGSNWVFANGEFCCVDVVGAELWGTSVAAELLFLLLTFGKKFFIKLIIK